MPSTVLFAILTISMPINNSTPKREQLRAKVAASSKALVIVVRSVEADADSREGSTRWVRSVRRPLVGLLATDVALATCPGPGPCPSHEGPDSFRRSARSFAVDMWVVSTCMRASPDDNCPRTLMASAQSPMRR